MNTTIKTLFIFSLPLLFISCGGKKDATENHSDSTATTAEIKNEIKYPRQQFIENAKTYEKKLHESKQLDRSTAIMAVKAFSDFAYSFPDDSLAPEYLFKGADIAKNALQEYQQALVYLKTITDRYPNYKLAGHALFIQAMIYDDNIKDSDDKAKNLYQEVIKKHPNTQLAKDAAILIKNTEKSPEQFIREIEKKDSNAKPKENAAKKEAGAAPRFVFPSILISDNSRIG